MDLCPNCAAELQDGARACPACGYAASSSAPTLRTPADPVVAADPREPLQLGAVLGGRFRLVALLGRGAMGEVYRADDLKIGQVVALKFLPPAVANDAVARQRFYSEVRVGRQVSHANVCRLHDLAEIDGRHCLSMEFIEGEDLASRLERLGAMSPSQCQVLAEDLLGALAAAHAKGVIHRDLKPANILLDAEGRAHIADFGIAALAEEIDRRELAGTMAYLAPELLDGEPASARSDLYALGLVLFESATGRRRFSARTPSELKLQHADTAAPDLGAAQAGLPEGLRKLIVACLQREPGARPDSARDAARLLAPPVAAAKGARAWQLVALAALLALGGAFGWYLQSRPQDELQAARLGPASAAVLPFTNMSGDKRNEFFSDGMTDTLLDRLAQVPQLKIAARTSSFAFKGKPVDVREIGRALGVATVVEGSVQQQGDTLRITAQLIRVADGSHLWSRQYDRPAKDLFAIQDEIAGAITTELAGKLLPSSQAALARRGTRSLEAYAAYVKGHQALATISLASFKHAEALLREALDKDPEYVAAMLDLVQAWGWQQDLGELSTSEFVARAGPVLDRVAALDPANPRMFALRAWLAQMQGQASLARRLVERALAAAPGDRGVRMNATGVYFHQRNYPMALRQVEEMIVLDPLDPYAHAQRASLLSAMKRQDEAEASARRALQLDPGSIIAMVAMANISARRDDLPGTAVWAVKIFALNPDAPTAVQISALFRELGEKAVAEAWLARARQLKPRDNPGADALELQWANFEGRHRDALALARRLLPTGSQDSYGVWTSAMALACNSAAAVGELEAQRAALVAVSALPRSFSRGDFDAWAGTQPREEKLQALFGLSDCNFRPGPADAGRRAGLRALAREVAGTDWEKGPDARVTVARLSDDREQIVAFVSTWTAVPPGLFESNVRMLGVDQDPRVRRQLEQVRSKYAQARTRLGSRFARERVSMLPPPG